jgi:hypothetical protein
MANSCDDLVSHTLRAGSPRVICTETQRNDSSVGTFGPGRTDNICLGILHYVLSTIIVVFHSKNLLSTLIRSAMVF